MQLVKNHVIHLFIFPFLRLFFSHILFVSLLKNSSGFQIGSLLCQILLFSEPFFVRV